MTWIVALRVKNGSIRNLDNNEKKTHSNYTTKIHLNIYSIILSHSVFPPVQRIMSWIHKKSSTSWGFKKRAIRFNSI